MFSLKKQSTVLYGAVLDIRSGSVGAALLKTDLLTGDLETIYTTRKKLMSVEQPTDTLRSVKEALLSIILELTSTGVTEMRTKDPSAHINKLYISISAPWVHVASRNVRYQTEEKAAISKDLIDDLSQTAAREAMEILKEKSLTEMQNLALIDQSVTSLSANGYFVGSDSTAETDSLTLTHSSSYADKDLLSALEEIIVPAFGETELIPFAYATQCSSILRTKIESVGIITISGNYCEFVLQNQKTAQSVIVSKCGSLSLLQDIVKHANIPVTEAAEYLKENNSVVPTDSIKKAVGKAVDKFREVFVQSLNGRESEFSIPESIYIVVPEQYNSFFKATIKDALREVTSSKHTVHNLATVLREKKAELSDDNALTVASYFFHTTEQSLYGEST